MSLYTRMHPFSHFNVNEEMQLSVMCLHCCVVDFQIAFYKVPCEHTWKDIEELVVLSKYTLTISQMYERMRF